MAMKYKIKRESNDELRQRFIDRTVPQAEIIGLTAPDEKLELQADGTYKWGEIDWEEFKRVVSGNGPCNRQRLNHHRKAHADGQWVREAAIAFHQKQSKKLEKA
jgi:ring-1,2-phenylacetyl-CoA epoxidase subunit PaaA